MSVVIVTDSSSDINAERARQLGIDVVPIWLLIGDRRLRDGVDIDNAAFFASMASVEELPRTEPPSTQDFADVFGRQVDAGNQVVAIVLAASLSKTFENAQRASAGFPDAVTVVDSKCGSGMLAQLVERAVELVAQGRTAAEIAADVQRCRAAGHGFFAMPDVRFLGRSGRLPKPIVALGSLLNVSLVLRMGEDGAVGLAAQSRSFEKSQELMIDAILRNVAGIPNVRLGIAHVNDPVAAANLVRRVRERAPELGEPIVHEIGPTIAVHLGSGAVGVSAIVT